MAYIHLNPVHHGFIQDCAAWPWSSYCALLSDKATLLKREEVLRWFGNKREFAKFHLHLIPKESNP
jgi:hypothetical protein